MSCRVLGVVSYGPDGRLASVRSDESSELGIICKLGEHSADIVYSADRLHYPMRRKGPKGTYNFERITWDDAYDIIVESFIGSRLNMARRRMPFIPDAEALNWQCATSFNPKG